ncbi:MAG TPA: type I restriction enzyme HsdR N-terminal domain-containing protein [Luteibaculaceae bacterium]|nr:type I restriction enzyme HsdR N-terminal domain-containing protein [Luteibaculaceae bacterium]
MDLLPKLGMPQFPFRTRASDRLEIWDRCRKRWIKLTPEEWVRQHWIWYLIESLGYPESWFAIEQRVKKVGFKHRTDIVVGHPAILLVECKAPSVAITQQTADQAFKYNLTVQAPALGLSNGFQHLFFSRDPVTGQWKQTENFPPYHSLRTH